MHTGDEALFNEHGDLFIVDRLKVCLVLLEHENTKFIFRLRQQEILKVRGFQVAPAELEGHLLNHEYVKDAGVVCPFLVL